MLSSFVFKDSQQQHCLLRNMTIECHVRSDLALPGTRANQIAISSFCPLFYFSVRYFTFQPTISIRTARTLFASKHDHRMSRSIRFGIARRKSQSNCYFKFLPAILLLCPLFHFSARYFNKNSKTTSQSDLRNNA